MSKKLRVVIRIAIVQYGAVALSVWWGIAALNHLSWVPPPGLASGTASLSLLAIQSVWCLTSPRSGLTRIKTASVSLGLFFYCGIVMVMDPFMSGESDAEVLSSLRALNTVSLRESLASTMACMAGCRGLRSFFRHIVRDACPQRGVSRRSERILFAPGLLAGVGASATFYFRPRFPPCGWRRVIRAGRDGRERPATPKSLGRAVRRRGTSCSTATADWPSGAVRVTCREDLEPKEKPMVIVLDPELETTLNELARSCPGIAGCQCLAEVFPRRCRA